MLMCRKCFCYCDASDLVNGICDDCRGKDRMEREHRDKMDRLAHMGFKQLRLEGVIK